MLIQPLGDGISFRLHLAGGVHDFSSVAECVEYAHREAPSHLKEIARRAGAGQVEIKVVRHDRRAPVKGGWGAEIYLGTDMFFTAVGRPGLEENPSGTGGAPPPGELIEA